jgi:probable O-glycosylation ligase (exosortase A-associated)
MRDSCLGEASMRDYLFLALLIALVPVCFFRPFVGILAWTWISYFNPHRFTWGFAQELPAAMVVAIATIGGFLFSSDRRLPPMKRETILLLLLWVWFALTTVSVYFSREFFHHLPDSVERLGAVSKMLLMTFFAMILVTDRHKLRSWYLVTAGSFAVLAFKGAVFGALTAGQFRVMGPQKSMVADNNAFGLALNMCLPMFFYLAKLEESRRLRMILRIAFLFTIAGVILTYSRGALIGLAVVLLTLAFKSKYKLPALAVVGVAALLVVALAPTKWIRRMETLKTAKDTDPSALSRINAWTLATRLALDYPIMGGGFQTFTAPVYDRYGLREGPVILGPHSIYFQVLGEHGFPGLLMFLGLIGSCLLSCRKIRRQFATNALARWPAAYADMITVSLLAFASSGAFLGLAYFDLFYQLAATTVILKCLVDEELNSEAEETSAEASALESETEEYSSSYHLARE